MVSVTVKVTGLDELVRKLNDMEGAIIAWTGSRATVSTELNYAGFVHDGTRFMAARPFMTDAWNTEQANVETDVQAGLEAVLAGGGSGALKTAFQRAGNRVLATSMRNTPVLNGHAAALAAHGAGVSAQAIVEATSDLLTAATGGHHRTARHPDQSQRSAGHLSVRRWLDLDVIKTTGGVVRRTHVIQLHLMVLTGGDDHQGGAGRQARPARCGVRPLLHQSHPVGYGRHRGAASA